MKRSCALIGVILLLGACATTPSTTPARLETLFLADPGQAAYIWTRGWSRDWLFVDIATITLIDGVRVLGEILPEPLPLSYPGFALLLEIPSGDRQVHIVYDEISASSLLFPYSLTSAYRLRTVLTLTAAPGRVYVPFAGDACSKEWVWDRGSGAVRARIGHQADGPRAYH